MDTHFDLVPDAHKIAVLRANAVGDFLITLPALEALHLAYPEAEIVLLGKAWHENFLRSRPGPVSRVIVVPPYGGVTTAPDSPENLTEREQFFAAMARERFDIALQLHGGGRYSNPFVKNLGARLTVGLKTPDAIALDRWLPYVFYQPEIMRYLEVVSLIGAKPNVLEPRIAVAERDLVEARQLVPEQDRPLVALHPGSSDPERRWSPQKFATVGDALAAAGARIVVTGSEEERAIVEAVVEAMHVTALNLCGTLSLGGLAGLLSRCCLVVSNDTGPLHLALAVGTPAVGIYWCINYANYGHPYRLHHRPLISWRTTCPLCHSDRLRLRCDHHPSFVDDVPVEEVYSAAMDLFATRS